MNAKLVLTLAGERSLKVEVHQNDIEVLEDVGEGARHFCGMPDNTQTLIRLRSGHQVTVQETREDIHRLIDKNLQDTIGSLRVAEGSEPIRMRPGEPLPAADERRLTYREVLCALGSPPPPPGQIRRCGIFGEGPETPESKAAGEAWRGLMQERNRIVDVLRRAFGKEEAGHGT